MVTMSEEKGSNEELNKFLAADAEERKPVEGEVVEEGTTALAVLTKIYKDLERTGSALEAQKRQYMDALKDTDAAIVELEGQREALEEAIKKLSS